MRGSEGTHVVDLSSGDAMGSPDDVWPPLTYWPKWKLPKHPREAKYKPATPLTLLLYRDAGALALSTATLAQIVAPISRRALEIYTTSGR